MLSVWTGTFLYTLTKQGKILFCMRGRRNANPCIFFLTFNLNFLCGVCETCLSVEKKISAPHCEFMRQALGSRTVQSAVLITSDVSRCLGLCWRRAGKGWQRSLVGRRQGWGALGLFVREECCSDYPVVHCCKNHEPKPTQNIDSTVF